MTGDDVSANGSRAAQSNPGAETRDSQHVEAQSQPQHRRQQETKTQPSSSPSSRPLPPSHQESLNTWLPLPPPHAIYPASLPVDQLHDHVETERLESPIWWHKTKLGLLLLSLMVCAVIFGIGIALGFRVASYDSSDLGYGAVDYEFGLSGGGAGLAIVVTTLEFLKTLFSRRNEGLHPGALVAAHLIIWLVVLAAVVYTSFLNAYYRLNDQTTTFQHVLLAFDCILLLIHFALFVDACVMTNRLNRSSRGTVVVRVPIHAGAGYQGVPYPVYGYPFSFVPPRAGTQPGQQPVPLMTQIPPQTAEGTGPAPPQPAALYTGYYAPPPQEQSARQLPGDQVLVQGYYAQFPAPATATATAAGPSRNSRGTPPSALAKSSRSRQSQCQAEAETQSGLQTESAVPSEGLQAQSRPEGPGSEKNL